LLRLEASRARVSPSGLKTGGGAVRMVYVASSRRSRGDEAEDEQVDAMGCIGPCYPYFCCFHCIRPHGCFSLLVFCLGL
jgi:hypothetical protein